LLELYPEQAMIGEHPSGVELTVTTVTTVVFGGATIAASVAQSVITRRGENNCVVRVAGEELIAVEKRVGIEGEESPVEGTSNTQNIAAHGAGNFANRGVDGEGSG
jgi:hypothetical protein